MERLMQRVLELRTSIAKIALVMCLIGAGLATHSAGSGRSGFTAEEWLDGPEGLVEGIAAAETDGRIAMVYFYADWCGYCRQFEEELLGTPAFRAFVRENIAARVNPDKGDSERRLASFYGVRGYPTFFVYGSKSKGLIRVERHSFATGKPELLSPERFIERIIEASAR